MLVLDLSSTTLVSVIGLVLNLKATILNHDNLPRKMTLYAYSLPLSFTVDVHCRLIPRVTLSQYL